VEFENVSLHDIMID